MLKFYNTLHRQVEEFKPLKNKKAGLYTCGPTVYNYAHIGNLRTYVFEDILKRTLLYNGYKVKHIMNITDVGHLTSDADSGEDKMEKGARREGKTAAEIAKFYTEAFKKDLADLNILEADTLCRATDHIKEQIKLIKKLEKKGFTYRTADGIYFDTAKLPDYGELSNLKKQELRAGARVEIGDKKHGTDFALWKFSPKLEKRQMEWESPWGVGFPGWHIECSAMSVKYLGQPFDIHTGGIDHVPVHHNNEIAQSEAAEGKPLANYWLHGEFLLTSSPKTKGKMSKSGENFITLETLKAKNISPLSYRYWLLQTHYRKQLTFSFEALEAAQNGLNHLYRLAALLQQKENDAKNELIVEKFLENINDDLNTPAALALIWDTLKNNQLRLSTLLHFDEVLGLNIEANIKKHGDTPLSKELEIILTERETARANKDWAKSDELRKKLEDMGYRVEDGAGGTKLTAIVFS